MCIRILPSEVETRQQSSSGMIIPVLELITLHFGKCHVSELNNLPIIELAMYVCMTCMCVCMYHMC